MRSPLLRSSATIALGAAALVTLDAASPAVQRVDGYQITMKMTMEMPINAAAAGMPAGPIQMDVVIKSAGDRIRMEMDMAKMMAGRGGGDQMAGAAAMMGGMYILVQPDNKMVTVMPSMGMAMVADPGALFGGGGGAMGGMIKMTVDTLPGWLKVTDLGAGERILGFATRKFRVETKYKMTVSVMGTATTETIESTTETWVTSDPSEAFAALRKYSQTMAPQMMGGAKDIVEISMKKLPPNAVALRFVSMWTTEKGKSSVTMEVAEIKKATFEATEFEVPAGMQVMDMSAMMGGRGRGGLN
ncbi:MAG TPA: hypothetical protein VJR92_09490 [Gemmatimonadaceae bacterium]|nr:hypothetical protein [Gemmatimonadaceae bacterium]